jgi:hypothetical protein
MATSSSLRGKLKALQLKTPIKRSSGGPADSSPSIFPEAGESTYYDVDQRSTQRKTFSGPPLDSMRERSQGIPLDLKIKIGTVRSQTISLPIQPALPAFGDRMTSNPIAEPLEKRKLNLLYFCMRNSKFVGDHMIDRHALNLAERCKCCNERLYSRTNSGLSGLALKLIRQAAEEEAEERERLESIAAWEETHGQNR